MPRLPSDEVLGGLPEANSRRPIASFDTTAPAEAMQSLGRGIRDLGAGIGAGIQAYQNRQTEQDALDETTAKSERQVNILNLLDKANNSNDPNEVRGLTEQITKLDQDTLARIKDPQRRQQTAAEFAIDTTKQRIKLGERAKHLDDKNFTDGMNNEVEDARRKALDSSDPDVREAAKKVLDRKIEEAVTRRILTPEEAIARKRKWNDDFSYDAVKLLPPQDAAIALAKPVQVSADAKERQKIAFQYFLAKGWSPVHAAVIAGGATHEGRLDPNARNPGDGRDGSDSIGFGQWNSDRAERLKRFASMNRTSWNDFQTQLDFMQWELENTERGAAAALRGTSNLRDAASVFSDKYFRPRGSGKGGYESLDGWANRYGQAAKIAQEFGGLPPDPNVARLQALGASVPPEKRQQLFDLQEKEYNQQRKVAIETAAAERTARVNQLELDIIDGRAGRIEIDAARDNGDVSDADKVSKLYRMAEEQEKKQAAARLFADVMTNGRKLNALDPKEKEAAEQGVDVLSKSGKVSRPQAAGIIFERTGYQYMPKDGARVIRQGLNSTDVNEVQDAVQVAANAITNNARAFDNTEGGGDIEKAALDFRHFVYDLGMSQTDAAKRLMYQASEEYKSKIKVADADVKKFTDDMRKNAINELQGAKFQGGHWWSNNNIGSPEVRNAVAADYAELATQYFEETGDQKQAKRYALAQLDKLYGVSNGTLMKFPPEKVYPSIGKDAHGYVYRQAAEAVKQATGHDVKPEDISLLPIDKQLTGEAWKAGRPTPYNIGYFRDVDGFKVWETVFPTLGSRKGFVASPEQENERQRNDREQRFMDLRANRGVSPNTPPPVTAADVNPRSMKPGRPAKTPEQIQSEVDARNAEQQKFVGEMGAAKAGRDKFMQEKPPGPNVLDQVREATPANPLTNFPYKPKTPKTKYETGGSF